jgi:hypothetical protein
MSEYSASIELLLTAAALRARVEPPAPQWTGAVFNTELFSTPDQMPPLSDMSATYRPPSVPLN